MIVATRIPQLTEQFRAATIRAAQQRTAPAAGAAPRSDAAVRAAVQRLQRLGFTVTLAHAA